MICFLRRERRCFAVKGAGAGVVTAWCIGAAVLGVKASELVACLTLANEIPFITILRCAEERLWIQLIAVSLDEVGLVPQWTGLIPGRDRSWSIAHFACSAINGSGSAAARSRTGKSDAFPTLPSATQTLRRKPRRLIRLIGEFLKSVRNSLSSRFR